MATSEYQALNPTEVQAISSAIGTSGFNTTQKRILMRLADMITAQPVENRIAAANLNGVPGPQGPAGPTGPQGPIGLTGATGGTGPQGPQGLQGIAGPQGPQGATGATGSTGSQGPAGQPGSVWYTGAGAPAGGLGSNGDYYLNVSNGDVYAKTAGTWNIVGNIRGPQGLPGSGGGGSGVYQIGTGGSNIAPALSAFTMSGSTPPVYSGGKIVFSGASNLAAAIGAADTSNSTAYNISITLANFTGGIARVIAYGDTTGFSETGANLTAAGTYNFTLTTNASSGTQNNQFRIQAVGTSGTNSFEVTAFTATPATGGGVARDMTERVSEVEVSVVDFGADPTGVSSSDAAFASALAYSRNVFVPEGTYRLNNTFQMNRAARIRGEGRNVTIINSYVSGANHGMTVTQEGTYGRGTVAQLEGFQFRHMGSAQTASGGSAGNNNWSGIYVQSKVLARDLYIRDWTNDGIYFAPSDANEAASNGGTIDAAVFFSRWDNVWSKDNGRDGIAVRRGANANSFINCQFDRNGRYGFHHYTDGFATYGNTIRDGQASYNKQEGYRFANGTNIVTSGLYQEHNGTPTNTNADSYTNTPYDMYIGDNCTRSWIGIGVLYNQLTSTVRLPAFNSNTIQVWEGGRKLFGDT